MDVVELADDGRSFVEMMRLAERLAAERLGQPMLLSWYDAARGMESPNGVSECSKAEPTAGVRAYAGSRGGVLVVAFGRPIGSATLFCFADPD